MADQPNTAHPEDFCHRCGGVNPSWYVGLHLWRMAEGEFNGILCPGCFAADLEKAAGVTTTWELVPRQTRRADRDSPAASGDHPGEPGEAPPEGEDTP